MMGKYFTLTPKHWWNPWEWHKAKKQEKVLEYFFKKNQRLPKEYEDIINKNFWDLL
jgi:hypothetical protein